MLGKLVLHLGVKVRMMWELELKNVHRQSGLEMDCDKCR